MTTISTLYNRFYGFSATSYDQLLLADNIASVITAPPGPEPSTPDDVDAAQAFANRIGSGIRVSELDTTFSTANYQATFFATDLAIIGNGFFLLRQPTKATAEFYSQGGRFEIIESTRPAASVFNFVNPLGFYVQGVNLNSVSSSTGGIEDVLVGKIAPPEATGNVEVIVNLENDPAAVETVDSTLYDNWDGRRLTGGRPDPISDDAFDFSSSIAIFDQDGGKLELTIYFDHTRNRNEREFLVTSNPELDRRLIAAGGSRYNQGLQTVNKGAGALLYGVLQFNDEGDLIDMIGWKVPADGNVNRAAPDNLIQLGRGDASLGFSYNFNGIGPDRRATLNFGTEPVPQKVESPAGVITDPLATPPTFITATTAWADTFDASGRQATAGDVITFTGASGDGTAVAFDYRVNPDLTVQDLLTQLESRFNAGASLVDGKVRLLDKKIGDSELAIASITYKDKDGNDPAANSELAELFGSQGVAFAVTPHNRFAPGKLPSTNFRRESFTIFQQQDGVPTGYLEDITVDRKGIISGTYTNSRTIEQAQLALVDVANRNVLERVGGNLFFAASQTGLLTTSLTRSDIFGRIIGRTTQTSNVDLALEYNNLVNSRRFF